MSQAIRMPPITEIRCQGNHMVGELYCTQFDAMTVEESIVSSVSIQLCQGPLQNTKVQDGQHENVNGLDEFM